MNATAIKGAVSVVEIGQGYFVTDCADYDAYRTLPKACEFQGKAYGLTGWNSDSCRAYYKVGMLFAVGA